jgi:hypothetical protein
MRTTPWLAAALALLLAGCYSPTYHDGNLKCTASGECPENYHCAVDHTCWRNGSDPDALPPLADAVGPDTAAAPDGGADQPDAAPDGPATTDLPAGVEVAAADAPSPADAATDVPLGQDTPITPPSLDAADAPAIDVPTAPDGLDGGEGEAGSAGLSLTDLAAAYAQVVCAKNFACCPQADLRGKALATCEQNVANLFQNAVQAISDGVGRGRTLYYPERAEQCLQRLVNIACGDWPVYDPTTWLPPICEQSIEPQVTAGGPCRSAFECVTGLCTGANANTDGTCLPKAASGQSCVAIFGQSSCERELYCDSTGVCSPTKVEGQSCGGNRDCKSQTCGPAPDAGNVCLPQVCYSNGPLLPAACSLGGRPSAFAGLLVLAAFAMLWRRRRAGGS